MNKESIIVDSSFTVDVESLLLRYNSYQITARNKYTMYKKVFCWTKLWNTVMVFEHHTFVEECAS